jgi:hypothetical protein
MMPDKEIRLIAREELAKLKSIPKGCKPFSESSKPLAGATATGVTKASTREAITTVLSQISKLKKTVLMSEPRLAETLPKDAAEYVVENGPVKLLFTHSWADHPAKEHLQIACWYHQ